MWQVRLMARFWIRFYLLPGRPMFLVLFHKKIGYKLVRQLRFWQTKVRLPHKLSWHLISLARGMQLLISLSWDKSLLREILTEPALRFITQKDFSHSWLFFKYSFIIDFHIIFFIQNWAGPCEKKMSPPPRSGWQSALRAVLQSRYNSQNRLKPFSARAKQA